MNGRFFVMNVPICLVNGKYQNKKGTLFINKCCAFPLLAPLFFPIIF
jgi:hypothetical protein